jgi:hypothetical protein
LVLHRSIDHLDLAECLRLLGLASLGRVGLNAEVADTVVAFPVDSYSQTSGSYGSSVLARGLATRITDPVR